MNSIKNLTTLSASVLSATIKAIETIDKCVGKVVQTVKNNNGVLFVNQAFFCGN